MKRLRDNLEQTNHNYLYPFFWQHGESLDVLEDYLNAMNSQGIQNLCIESRPHPEFMEEGWWKTMDFLMEESKKRGMKIWILDDARFPTGFANGKVPEHLKKKYLKLRKFDVVGTRPCMDLNISSLESFRVLMSEPEHKNDVPVKVLIAQKDPSNLPNALPDTLQDVTDWLSEDKKTLHLKLDKKHYTIYVLYQTSVSEEKTTQDYLDPMDPKGTDILLQEVYEKHYDHYKNEFGSVIEAFFSDEPRFGNAKGPDHVIGKSSMPLPYNREVHRLLEEQIKPEEWVCLFEFDTPRAHAVRDLYMDIVSGLYAKNFSQRIGRWCHEHGVKYVGHVIEDNNVHARLGYGPGHYFRAMSGEDVAGIDIIGGQVVPGMNYHHDAFSTGGSDGEFYHAALCSLAKSEARLNPKKDGTVMCEAFGAYGWIEGLKMMKWITDLMIVSGVNLIVPHAFDPKEFPDFDCPPHFYAHGSNPQYPYFGKWSAYANRLCHLFSGGEFDGEVGILYQARGEWSGGSQFDQKIIKALQENQIESYVISDDYLMDAKMEDHALVINGKTFRVLIVPQCSQLPADLLEKIEEVSKHIPVLFVHEKPGYEKDGIRIEEPVQKNQKVIAMDEMAREVKAIVSPVAKISSKEPWLRAAKYRHEDGSVYFFMNEDILKPVDTKMQLNPEKDYVLYNAMDNTLESCRITDGSFHLHLEPYESLVLIEAEKESPTENRTDLKSLAEDYPVVDAVRPGKQITSFIPELKKGLNYRKEEVDADPLKNGFSSFSGTLFYENEVEADAGSIPEVLEIPCASELVSVQINGKDAGAKLAPPYVFDIRSQMKEGTNQISIQVINTLANALKDPFSSYIPLENPGIEGEVLLKQAR